MFERYLFSGIEHVRDIDGRFTNRTSELEHDGQPTFHIGRAQAIQDLTLDPSGCIVVDGDGVEVPSQRHTKATTKIRSCDDIVTNAGDLESIDLSKLSLEPGRDCAFLETHRRHVDQVSGQLKKRMHHLSSPA